MHKKWTLISRWQAAVTFGGISFHHSYWFWGGAKMFAGVVVVVVVVVVFVVLVVVDRFYIALFSALKQTHCARM